MRWTTNYWYVFVEFLFSGEGSIGFRKSVKKQVLIKRKTKMSCQYPSEKLLNSANC